MKLHSLKRLAIVAVALGTAVTLHASAALAADGPDGHGHGHHPHCDRVEGKAVWTLIPAPNDPLGRVLGPATGDLKAAVSAHLTSLGPQPDGTLKGYKRRDLGRRTSAGRDHVRRRRDLHALRHGRQRP